MRREWLHTFVLGTTVALLSVVVPMARGEDVAKPTKYMLGVSCEPVDDALRAQLKLPDGAGLVLHKILPDSAAAAAGLERFDVLLTLNKQPLLAPKDLLDVIEAAGDQEVTLELLRAGERKTVTVKPKPAPALVTPYEPEAAQPFTVKIMRPGQLVSLGGALTLKLPAFDLPEDATVTITHHGKDKAKIKVEHKDKTWEVTEDNLDELPERFRRPIEAMTRMVTIGSRTPPAPGDVLLYTPNAPTIAQYGQNAVDTGVKWLQQHAKESGADVAYQQALSQAKVARTAAQQRLQQATQKLAELEERYRPSKVLEEDVTPRVEGAVEEARRWSLEQLDSRFDQLQKQLDELRQAVKAARRGSKPAAPPAEPEPPAAPTPPADPAPPAKPEAPEAP